MERMPRALAVLALLFSTACGSPLPATEPAPPGTTPPAQPPPSTAMPQDVPLLDDAREVASFMGSVTYRTYHTVEEAQAFYDAQMVTLGWTNEGGFPGFSTFTRDGRTAQVVMTPDEGETVVTVRTTEQ
jgi:hypothetical protein